MKNKNKVRKSATTTASGVNATGEPTQTICRCNLTSWDEDKSIHEAESESPENSLLTFKDYFEGTFEKCSREEAGRKIHPADPEIDLAIKLLPSIACEIPIEMRNRPFIVFEMTLRKIADRWSDAMPEALEAVFHWRQMKDMGKDGYIWTRHFISDEEKERLAQEYQVLHKELQNALLDLSKKLLSQAEPMHNIVEHEKFMMLYKEIVNHAIEKPEQRRSVQRCCEHLCASDVAIKAFGKMTAGSLFTSVKDYITRWNKVHPDKKIETLGAAIRKARKEISDLSQ